MRLQKKKSKRRLEQGPKSPNPKALIQRDLIVSVCQMKSSDDWNANLVQMLNLLKELESAPEVPQFVTFPENCLYLRLDDKKPSKTFEISDNIFSGLQKWADKQGALLHLGSVPISEAGHKFNASVLIYPNGRRAVIYRKMHLFDVEIAGHRSHRESDSFEPGRSPAIFEWKGWRFGSSICYDLRFAELYQYYSRREVDVLLVPSAFTVPTGKAHWHTLLRARAIEGQCFVLAAAQGGRHSTQRQTYGHSLVVDSWGRVVAESRRGEWLLAELKHSEIEMTRTQIPMKNHRHPVSEFEIE